RAGAPVRVSRHSSTASIPATSREFDCENFTLLISHTGRCRTARTWAEHMAELLRKGHFLGAKLRSIRRRNGLTLEELSVRCIQHKPDIAPSVSYLSMIESGKRMPSSQLLALLADIFQRPSGWFLDENAALDLPAPVAGGPGARIPLEPA